MNNSPIFCTHANENPNICPCDASCWCRQSGRMCYGKDSCAPIQYHTHGTSGTTFEVTKDPRFDELLAIVNGLEGGIACYTSSHQLCDEHGHSTRCSDKLKMTHWMNRLTDFRRKYDLTQPRTLRRSH